LQEIWKQLSILAEDLRTGLLKEMQNREYLIGMNFNARKYPVIKVMADGISFLHEMYWIPETGSELISLFAFNLMLYFPGIKPVQNLSVR
jgi:hypothetical protein